MPDPDQSDAHELLGNVATIAPVIAADAVHGEIAGRLTPAVVDALRDSGVFWMRLPREAGGRESSVETQLQVIAALAEIDASTAWCVMVGGNAVAKIATTMPESAVDVAFADHVPLCSTVAAPAGVATKVDGGYLLTGTWRLASGIHHSEWVYARTSIDRDPSRPLRFIARVHDVTIADTWNAVGLRATGSADFLLEEVFIPEEWTSQQPEKQLRGVRRYDLPGFVMVEPYEHLAFALGVARRALRELVSSLATDEVHRRSADREVVQHELGRAQVRFDAVEALAYTLVKRFDETATSEADHLAGWGGTFLRAVAAEATEMAADCVQLAFRRGATRSIYAGSVMERLMRDISAAGTHVIVDDTALADYGTQLILTDTYERVEA